jgi:hypothetical protein
MKLIRQIIFSMLVLGVAATGAHALTEAEQAQLDSLVEQAASISEGATVGGAKIVAQDGWLLQGEQACTYSRLLNADVNCYTSAIVFPNERYGIDSIYYEPPTEIGHVNMDDWAEDVTSQIDEI